MQKVIQFSIACWYPQTLLIKSISISSSAFIIILSFLNRRLSLFTENSQLPFPDIFLQWITFIECFCFIFSFPKERKWRNAWIKKIGYPRWKASVALIICSLHFEESCFRRTRKNRIWLEKMALPSKFHCSSKEYVVSSCFHLIFNLKHT